MRLVPIALVPLLALLTAVSAEAAIVAVTPVATAVLEPDDLSFVDPSFFVAPGTLLAREEPYLIQVDVSMRITDLQPGQLGFSNTAFNVDLYGDGIAYSNTVLGISAWLADFGADPTCASPPQPFCPPPLYEFNEDAGIDKNDLQAVILAGYTRGFGPIDRDPRPNLGKDEDGDHAGTFYILLPGTPGAFTAAELITPWGASTYDETGQSTTLGNVALGGSTSVYRIVPEPASWILLAIAFPLVAYRFRR